MSVIMAVVPTTAFADGGEGCMTIEEYQQTLTQEELDTMSKVDAKICKMMNKDEWKEGTFEDRRRLAKRTLKRLKKQDLIKTYRYEDEMYAFTYITGIKGGVMLKEFDSLVN